MNKKTQQITTGAAMIAIFALMLLINRQTGDLFQEIFLFIFPLPMVAYAVQYDWKSSVPVFIAMSLISLLFGSPLTIFYAVTEALIGFVFGSCLYRKVEATRTLFIVMGLSAVVNVLNTIVLADLFGMSLNEEIAEMQNMMNMVFEKSGYVLPEGMLSVQYLKQLMIISMIFLGMVQGLAIYEITMLVLKRLRFPVQKLKSIYLLFPPKWLGYVALAGFFGYGYTFTVEMDEFLKSALQALGVCGNIFLVCFGFIAVMLFVKVRMPNLKVLGIIFCILAYMMMPMLVLILGFAYVSTSLHQRLLEGTQRMLRG